VGCVGGGVSALTWLSRWQVPAKAGERIPEANHNGSPGENFFKACSFEFFVLRLILVPFLLNRRSSVDLISVDEFDPR